MTAIELIEELKKIPPDTSVVLKRSSSEFYEVSGVELQRAYEDSQGYYSKVEWPSDWKKIQVARLRFG